MLQKYNRWKVLQVFFDDPEGYFQLREMGRKVRLATVSVKLILEYLLDEGLIKTEKIKKYLVYVANRDSEAFRFLKKMNSLIMISESGILGYLGDLCMPDAIILFGSTSRGEDTKNSDIDLFLLCQEISPDLSKFEKILDRKINLLFSGNFRELSNELKNNIINGIVLKGYLKVF
ncbi:MAG: nucleotidyltransferase domain-containing protein [Candidatus Aenigmarchaeota archaeon]|nr:nucleotidyltransferase domain-containing protein [Candidatus Aenigmarchaeota archaeon]